MTTTIRAKLDAILFLEEKTSYDSAESMSESLIEEFNESEQESDCYEITDAVQEWWDAN